MFVATVVDANTNESYFTFVSEARTEAEARANAFIANARFLVFERDGVSIPPVRVILAKEVEG